MEKTEQSCQKKKMASTLSDDRLSALPDCVLTHILSFLSTKLSVSTSILGKRWRFLWSQVPILDFHCDDYRKKETALSKIINKVMMLHKVTKLETFRLCQEDACCCDFEFEARIATLIDRNVRNLSIYLVDQTKLPLCLFSCKTLVYLTLTGWSVCADIPMTGPVCLPALKKLHLTGVTFAPESTYESLPHLLSGCPVLEELLVDLFGKENTVVICHIASPTLKNLVLISEGSAVFNVKLDTRALRYLKLRGYFKLCGSMSNVSAGVLPSLVEADIGIYNGEFFNLFPCSVIEFVGKKLPNVKWLKLRTGQLEVHSSAFSALTIKFLNLTELELGTDGFILRFLENADNLQVLTIRKVYGHHLNWTDPKQVPACLASHLRTVKIHSVECTEQELSMMRYILKNAKVLKVMEIYSSLGIDKLQTLQRISTFEQGSETCQVVFT